MGAFVAMSAQFPTVAVTITTIWDTSMRLKPELYLKVFHFQGRLLIKLLSHSQLRFATARR
jgi:hypothetical protein